MKANEKIGMSREMKYTGFIYKKLLRYIIINEIIWYTGGKGDAIRRGWYPLLQTGNKTSPKHNINGHCD